MNYIQILKDFKFDFPDKFVNLGDKKVLAGNDDKNPLTGNYTVLCKKDTFSACYVAFGDKAIIQCRPFSKWPYGPQGDFVPDKILAVLDDSVADSASQINGDYQKFADAQMAAYRAKFADAIADSTKAYIDLTKKKDDDLLIDILANATGF